MENDDNEYKICDICKGRTNCSFDVLLFGDWQSSRDITVHYFCLLLSTHLPQRGQDNSGINGFLLRDIRLEINSAKKRLCCFCAQPHASIRCHKCKDYFHIVCGRRNRCLFQFCDEFRSFCDDCIPTDQLNPAGVQINPSNFERCTICKVQMGTYNPVVFIYGMCCNNGYAHNLCMQKYALASGYYLRCIWCRSPEFREKVRLQGIFVPDRDAQWERQRNAYRDLHEGHRRCDMINCRCPRGRDFIARNWPLIVCSLCGSTGAHNPKCIPGSEKSKVPISTFKCNICANTETAMLANQSQKQLQQISPNNESDLIDRTIFMNKRIIKCTPDIGRDIVAFSDEDSAQNSDGSAITVIRRNMKHPKPVQFTANLNVSHIESELTTASITESQTEVGVCAAKDSTPYIISTDSQEDPAEGIIETQLPHTSLDIDLDQVEKDGLHEHTALIDKTAVACTPTTQIEPSPEIPHSGDHDDEDETTQSPLITSTSRDQVGIKHLETFDMYEYDLENNKCIGTVTVSIDMNDERFAGRKLAEIQTMSELFTEEDVIRRSDDTGIFAIIDDIISQYE